MIDRSLVAVRCGTIKQGRLCVNRKFAARYRLACIVQLFGQKIPGELCLLHGRFWQRHVHSGVLQVFRPVRDPYRSPGVIGTGGGNFYKHVPSPARGISAMFQA